MKKMFRFLIMLLPFIALAQKKGAAYTDSLEALLPAAKEDSNKSILLYKIGVAYSNFNLSKTMLYAQQGLLLSQKINWAKGISTFYFLLGNVFMNTGTYDSAVFYYNKSYELDKKLKDENGQVVDLLNLGLTEATRGDGVKAMEYFTAATPIAQKVNDTTYLALLYNNISNVHFFNKNYTSAKQFTIKALTLARSSKNDDAIGSALSTLATIYHEQYDTINAMKYYNEALNIYLKNKNTQREAILFGNISILQKNKFDAIKMKLKAKLIWDTLSPSFTEAIKNTGNLGIDYFDLVNDSTEKYATKNELLKNKTIWLANAERYLKTAVNLSKKTGNVEWYWMYAGNLSNLYNLKGDYKNAHYFLLESTRVQDSIYSQDNKNKIAAIENRKALEVKNKEIEIKNQALQNEKKQRIAMILGLLLFAVIGILLFRLNRIRKKSNNHLTTLNKELDNANKLKAKFFAILSHDLRGPIASMVSYLNIREDNPQQMSLDDNSRFQKNIKKSAETLLTNMDEVLLWSKGQMNNFSPALKNISADKIFTYLENSFEAETKIAITYSNPDDVMLYTDENYLQTIMQNLTGNAIKSLQNTIEPIITWTVHQHNEKTIFLITDNGSGIKQEQLISLYEETLSPNAKTGFGLHLIRDLAKAINCTITVEKNINTQGTCFKLEL